MQKCENCDGKHDKEKVHFCCKDRNVRANQNYVMKKLKSFGRCCGTSREEHHLPTLNNSQSRAGLAMRQTTLVPTKKKGPAKGKMTLK